MLTVANSGGCANTAAVSRYIRVVDGIQPNFTYNQVSPACTPPFNISFVNQTAGPGNLAYAWNFGTGAQSRQFGPCQSHEHHLPNAGDYTINLQVVSDLGCSQTLQQTISFSQYAASFSAPATVCLNSPATFTNTSTPISSGSIWGLRRRHYRQRHTRYKDLHRSWNL